MMVNWNFKSKYSLQSILTVIIFSMLATNSYLIVLAQDTTKTKKTLLLHNERNKLTPVDYFTKDTLLTPNKNEGIMKPGYSDSQYHSPRQDTIYKRALSLHIPTAVRFSHDFKIFSEQRNLERELEKGLPWQIALENLRIRPDIMAPLQQDIVHRQEMINNSLYIPFMPNRITSGFSFDAREVAVFFGLAEDVSPVMTFDLKYAEEIEIVIYSIQASVIATMFKGVRQAGSHKFVWNGRDDKGRPVESGDYIGEIRIGNTRFVRKRITIP